MKLLSIVLAALFSGSVLAAEAPAKTENKSPAKAAEKSAPAKKAEKAEAKK